MAEVIWTQSALADTHAIASYIALDNPSAASALIDKILSSCRQLEHFPQRARIPPELPSSVYRELVSPPCRIFYKCEQQRVIIVHVMRDEQQLRLFMLGTS